MIWDFSLPGPRILCVSSQVRLEERLHFPRSKNPSNPVALSACRESREVALKRYRLCFGTTNIYADLAGGDILHLGPAWDVWEGPAHSSINLRKWYDDGRRGGSLYREVTDCVKNDLERVTHLSMWRDIWYIYEPRSPYSHRSLRKDTELFSNLQRLSLVDGGSAVTTQIRTNIPGTVELVDLSQVVRDRDYTGTTALGEVQAPDLFRVREEFLEKALAEQEKTNGIPDVQVVGAVHVPFLPDGEWESDYGEPFVRVHPMVQHLCNLLILSAVPS